MSLAVIYLKEGVAKEQKGQLIARTKEACMKGLGVGIHHSFCQIQEIKEENCDEETKRMVNLMVYTTVGKTVEGKDLVCQLFEKACRDILGEDFGYSIVIFKEHTDENAGNHGHLRPFLPEA